MENIKDKLDSGVYKLTPNDTGKATWWLNFQLIVDENAERTGHVQCIRCHAIFAYDSKKTGSSHLQRHSERSGCKAIKQSAVTTSTPVKMTKFFEKPVTMYERSLETLETEQVQCKKIIMLLL